eukprot:scaffold21265_cov131-Isochrysis_galbana.AAC.2
MACAMPELPAAAKAPAEKRAIGQQRARELLPARDLRDRGSEGHSHRLRHRLNRGGDRPCAQLPRSIAPEG